MIKQKLNESGSKFDNKMNIKDTFKVNTENDLRSNNNINEANYRNNIANKYFPNKE